MEPSAGQLESTRLVERHFTTPGLDPFDVITWTRRDVWVGTKHEHLSVEAPDFWSDNAVGIVSKLYLSKAEGSRENSVRELVERIAAKIVVEGIVAGYFGNFPTLLRSEIDAHGKRLMFCRGLISECDPKIMYDELRHIMINQLAVFNSPVLFNVGRDDRDQQVSACFILGVDDTTESIIETSEREINIFRGGSGSGSDLSAMRASMEPLTGGGTSSGPVSFMRLWDAGAGTFKSGGKTRRAAILRKLDVDHPDIREFITCKVREEERLYMALDAGIDIGFSEEGERNVAEMTAFQNANNSVGVPDFFMEMALDPSTTFRWALHARSQAWRDQHDGNTVVGFEEAEDLLDLIASSAHAAACPGMFFMDSIQRMHTTPMLDGVRSPIKSSNPCGEYLSNDDTSCNLGSINILQFVSTGTYGGKRRFDVDDFRQVVDVMTVSMDILVTLGYFPDPKIAERSGKLRQLGLGYSNMGAAIMAQGFAYDSDEGRDFAASVTALETGRIYRKSAEMAKLLGAFHYFDENSESMLGVIDKHIMSLPENSEAGSIWATAAFDWNIAAIQGREHGFRNAQASVIPPAGTTSFFLDCDTTGIEPAFMLVTHKELAGGGTMTLVNQSVTRAANALGGYSVENIEQMNAGDFSCCSPEDAAVFHTANEISPAGHIKMMAAVQPFVSGAISKTINMHEDATVEDVKAAYVLAWQLGCKDLAIYRNGSKARQPHSAKPKKEHKIVVEAPGLAGDEQTVTITGSPTGETTKIRIEDGQLKVEGSETVAYELMKSVDKIITPEELEAAVKAGKPGDGYDWIRKMNDDAFSKAVAGGPQVSQISPPARDRLAKTCLAKRHKIHLRGQMGDYEGYVHVGMYPNGRLGEMFISGFGRAGSFTVNALQAWATDFSIAIQYGIDWRTLARKHLGVSDETGGMVVPEPGASGTMPIRSAKSIFDYIVRFLALEFGDGDDHREFGVRSKQAEYDVSSDSIRIEHTAPLVVKSESNGHGHNPREIFGPRCTCGGMLRPTGGCFTCMSCAATTGCG